MGTLFQKALYFKKYFSIGLFVAVCLCLLKTEIKQEKLLLRCFLKKIMVYHSTFSHGLELKTKNKKRNTAISNRNTCRIESIVIVSNREVGVSSHPY